MAAGSVVIWRARRSRDVPGEPATLPAPVPEESALSRKQRANFGNRPRHKRKIKGATATIWPSTGDHAAPTLAFELENDSCAIGPNGFAGYRAGCLVAGLDRPARRGCLLPGASGRLRVFDRSSSFRRKRRRCQRPVRAAMGVSLDLPQLRGGCVARLRTLCCCWYRPAACKGRIYRRRARDLDRVSPPERHMDLLCLFRE